MSKEERIYTLEEKNKASEYIASMTLFSNEMTLAFRDKDYAAYSLNVLLGLDVTAEMKNEMVIHAENWLKNDENRDARLDAVITIPSKKIHIEIQRLRRKDEVPRSMFYMGSMLVDIAKGETRIEPYNITSIWICDFNPLEDDNVPSLPYYLFENTYKKKDEIYGVNEPFELNDGLTLIFINARFRWEQILEERKLTKQETALKEYIADMKQSDTSRIVHKEAATVLSLYKEGGRMYNKIHEEYMEFQKEEAEKLIEKGLKEGRELGIIEGKQLGFKEAKVNTAKKMLKDNMDPQIIAKYTGLDIETIKALK